MQLGEIIRTYRKQKQMTQEEMASQLGVTAPAVNKWERGNSFPDITLLSPIARLLDISLDTLLSFREDLTAEEIKKIIYEADRILKEKTYEEAFQWMKKKVEEYPNCESLILQTAVILDANRIIQKIPDSEKYDAYLLSLYQRALKSRDEMIRLRAADALVGFYMRKKQYDKAEEYLQYFSMQNPERKRKQAQIYSETNRTQKAYRAYEELLFVSYQSINLSLHGMYQLAIQTEDTERARMLAAKQAEIARCFEMGAYQEASCRLDLALMDQDADTTMNIIEELLDSIEELNHFKKSFLYEHMNFQETKSEFLAELKENLLRSLQEDEAVQFLKDTQRWADLMKKYQKMLPSE